MKSYWVWVSPKSIGLDTETYGEEGHVIRDTEIGVLQLQAKECHKPPEARKRQGRILPWSLS